MKYSKKVVNVPEAEYNALMTLVSAGNMDPLSREKYETDVKIQQNFRKPMLTQLEKNVKYQSLNRKRKKLAKMIQNKPLKIVVENAKTETPAPTEGIAPAQKPINNIQDAQQIIEPPVQNIEAEAEQNVHPAPTVKGVLDDFKGIIKEDFYEQLNNYINENKIKFGITKNGGILSNKATDINPINGSNYIKVIKFMTGESELEKWETRYAGGFIKRLLKDQRVNEFIEQSKDQEGQGFAKRKRFLIQLKTKPIKEAKTKGLIRAFKPVLWTKIPV